MSLLSNGATLASAFSWGMKVTVTGLGGVASGFGVRAPLKGSVRV